MFGKANDSFRSELIRKHRWIKSGPFLKKKTIRSDPRWRGECGLLYRSSLSPVQSFWMKPVQIFNESQLIRFDSLTCVVQKNQITKWIVLIWWCLVLFPDRLMTTEHLFWVLFFFSPQRIVQNVIDRKPKPRYFLAVDESQNTIADIIRVSFPNGSNHIWYFWHILLLLSPFSFYFQAIAVALGPGKTRNVPKEDVFLTEELTVRVFANYIKSAILLKNHERQYRCDEMEFFNLVSCLIFSGREMSSASGQNRAAQLRPFSLKDHSQGRSRWSAKHNWDFL